jgi:GTP-dependent phosphoenolpyruvate carboxykinase
VDRITELCQPDNVHVCTGTQEEFDGFMAGLIKAGEWVFGKANAISCDSFLFVPIGGLKAAL